MGQLILLPIIINLLYKLDKMTIDNVIKSGVIEYPELLDDIDIFRNYSASQDFKFYLINTDIRNKQELLHAIYTSYEFPDYFGFNWDALTDCLKDYSFTSAKGYIFGLANSKRIKEYLGKDYEVFIDIFKDASVSWQKYNVVFTLILG